MRARRSISILILTLDSCTCTMLLFNRRIFCQKMLVKSINRFLFLLKNSFFDLTVSVLFHLGAQREENSRPRRTLTWWRRRRKIVFTRRRPSTRQFIVNYIRLIITVISRRTVNFVNREFSIKHWTGPPLGMCAISDIWSQMINFVVTHNYVW